MLMSAQRKTAANAGAQRVSQPRAAGAELDSPKSPLPLHPQARKIARVGFAIALVALALWIARDFLRAAPKTADVGTGKSRCLFEGVANCIAPSASISLPQREKFATVLVQVHMRIHPINPIERDAMVRTFG
jgi:hypothetical protein